MLSCIFINVRNEPNAVFKPTVMLVNRIGYSFLLNAGKNSRDMSIDIGVSTQEGHIIEGEVPWTATGNRVSLAYDSTARKTARLYVRFMLVFCSCVQRNRRCSSN